MKYKQGFTLIEMMVVVVIAAVLMGAVSMSFPSSKGDDLLKEQMDRVVALINFAQDEAVLQSREFALAVDQSGYAFFVNNEGSWVEAQEAFSHKEFPDVIQPNLYIEGVPIALSKKSKTKPQILILSSGEVTPFTYKLDYMKELQLEIKVDGGGLVTRSEVSPSK
jgi:general secretion pathway protein H